MLFIDHSLYVLDHKLDGVIVLSEIRLYEEQNRRSSVVHSYVRTVLYLDFRLIDSIIIDIFNKL